MFLHRAARLCSLGSLVEDRLWYCRFGQGIASPPLAMTDSLICSSSTGPCCSSADRSRGGLGAKRGTWPTGTPNPRPPHQKFFAQGKNEIY